LNVSRGLCHPNSHDGFIGELGEHQQFQIRKHQNTDMRKDPIFCILF
jgi:hypothetical protein